MNRIITLLGLASLMGLSAAAQTSTAPAFPFTFYVHDTTGKVADYPLPSIYQFNATSLGSSTHVVLKVVNTSQAAAFMGIVIVTNNTTSTVQNPNFTVTGLAESIAVPIGGSLLFQVNFSPTTTTGPITAYMETSYQVQQNGCNFTSTSVSTQCPSGLNTSATLNATATAPQLELSYINSSGVATLMQPSSTPLNFGSVSTSSSNTITFTLSNQSTLSIPVPAISVPAPTVYSSNPYALDVSKVPTTLAGGSSANFTITFAPGQVGLVQTSLNVGTNTYTIVGEGIVVADIDALQISYVDSAGDRTLPQTATPISFGQIVAGTATSNSLVFTVTNPATSFNGVVITNITTTANSAFTISGLTGATAFPTALAPSASISFTVTFNPSSSGASTGALTIGTRSFTLTGLSINSPLPGFSLSVNPSPLSSQQQATVAVQLASASTLAVTGTISMTFAPSVLNITDDPAVVFLANNTRQLPISIASGSQSATYNGQSAITFQTGTTAGTITFTVNFPNSPAYTQSYTITPGAIQISSATAVHSNPNLVVTVTGYDNTYSAGSLNFIFYDTSGHAYPAIAYNAAPAFQNLFFANTNTAGGAFVLQATFPVTGDITKIGSVAVSLTNSVGQASQTLTFAQ